MDKKLNTLFILIPVFLAVTIKISFLPKKEVFHGDEVLTHLLSFSDDAFLWKRLLDKDKQNTWYPKKYAEDFLRPNKSLFSDLKTLYQNQKMDVHPPLYYLLFRVTLSVFDTFGYADFSPIPGITLNLFLFFISIVFLQKTLTLLNFSPQYSALIIILWSISNPSLSLILCIRMYALLSTIYVAFVYYFLKSNKNYDPYLIGLTTLGLLTHYYSIAFFGLFFLVSLFFYTRDKIKYIFVNLAIGSILAFCIFPSMLDHVFFGYRGVEAFGKFSFSGSDRFGHLFKFFSDLSITLTSPGVFLFIALIFGVVYSFRKRNSSKLKVFFLVSIIYLLFVMIASPYTDQRYLLSILPLFYLCLGDYLNSIKVKGKNIFTLLLISTMIIPILISKDKIYYIPTTKYFKAFDQNNYPKVIIHVDALTEVYKSLPYLLNHKYFSLIVSDEKTLRQIIEDNPRTLILDFSTIREETHLSNKNLREIKKIHDYSFIGYASD